MEEVVEAREVELCASARRGRETWTRVSTKASAEHSLKEVERERESERERARERERERERRERE